MKKIFKSPIFTFILGAIIFGGISIAFAYSYSAVQIGFSPIDITWQASNTKEAIDSLYNNIDKNRTIFFTTSWKGAKSWNNYGFSDILIQDQDYLTGGSIVTFNKKCKIKIIGYMRNTNASSASPQYKLYHNGQAILTFSNSAAAESIATRTIEVTVNKGDSMYLSMYGGGKATYYITLFELI